jgi:hypothetical protein
MRATRTTVWDKYSIIWNILGQDARPGFLDDRCPSGPLHVRCAMALVFGPLDAAIPGVCCRCRNCNVVSSFNACQSRLLRESTHVLWISCLPRGWHTFFGGSVLLTARLTTGVLGGVTRILRSGWGGVARSWRRTERRPSICWTRNWRSLTPSRSSKTKSWRMAECSRGRVGEGVFKL